VTAVAYNMRYVVEVADRRHVVQLDVMTVMELKSRQNLVSIYAVALSSYERLPAAGRHFPRSNDGHNGYQRCVVGLSRDG
jgi:hypothetical protein